VFAPEAHSSLTTGVWIIRYVLEYRFEKSKNYTSACKTLRNCSIHRTLHGWYAHNRNDLAEGWHLSSRALLIGMPLTMVATAVLARWMIGLGWTEAFLVGAALAPTDPVFASAMIAVRKFQLVCDTC
jgi:hypothetical protein